MPKDAEDRLDVKNLEDTLDYFRSELKNYERLQRENEGNWIPPMDPAINSRIVEAENQLRSMEKFSEDWVARDMATRALGEKKDRSYLITPRLFIYEHPIIATAGAGIIGYFAYSLIKNFL
jgi:hypothetical protein